MAYSKAFRLKITTKRTNSTYNNRIKITSEREDLWEFNEYEMMHVNFEQFIKMQ